jgi:hypothetical protein
MPDEIGIPATGVGSIGDDVCERKAETNAASCGERRKATTTTMEPIMRRKVLGFIV